MNPETAFTNAAGADVATIAFLVAGAGATAMLLWASWALISVWFGWSRRRVDMGVFERAVVRIVLLTVVIFWILI